MSKTPPTAFLCHTSDDKPLVRKLANDLLRNGVDVFFDEWEIGPGDSLRAKIDQGLAHCSHFLAVLSPSSLAKPWVNAELDAGYVLKIQGHCKLVPLRVDLPVTSLPPLLQGLYSPTLDDYDRGLADLVSSVHGISMKPAIGPLPIAALHKTGRLGLSPGAEIVTRVLITLSEHGLDHDPQLEADTIRSATQLSDLDIADAVHELGRLGCIRPVKALGAGALGFVVLAPAGKLFADYDRYFKPWDPAKDALVIANLLAGGGGVVVDAASQSLHWAPRRMNPAIYYLMGLGAVESSRSVGSYPWATHWLRGTAETRRFLRAHSAP